MQKVRAIESNNLVTLERKINQILDEINDNGYALMEIYYSSYQGMHNEKNYSALILYEKEE